MSTKDLGTHLPHGLGYPGSSWHGDSQTYSTGVAFASNTIVSSNTVENWFIWGLGDSNIIKSNLVSAAGVGIVIGGNNNTVQFNSLLNIEQGAAISFNCTGGETIVTHNIINDSDIGIEDSPGNVIKSQYFSNVSVIVAPSC
jgi:hypothetical protein